jgi:cyanate permease
MFPISMRSITGAFGAATQWLSSFAATMSAPHMQAAVGGWIFVFYGICCFATLAFTFVFIPETRGTPIESMAKLFGGPSRYSQWRQKKVWPPHGIPPPVTEDVSEPGSPHGEKAELEYVERV